MSAPTSGNAVARPDDESQRLVWAPPTAGRRLDGAWWPEARDAASQLAGLVPLVSEHLGVPVTRVSLNIDAWDSDQPRRLLVGDRQVRLGWFHTLDPATVTLADRAEGRVVLVVVPPSFEPAAARRLLRRLSTAPEWPDSATTALSDSWVAAGAGDEA